MVHVVIYEPRRLVCEGLTGYLRDAGIDVTACLTTDQLACELTGERAGTVIVSLDGDALQACAMLARHAGQLHRFRVIALASMLDQVTARRVRSFGVGEVVAPDIGLRGVLDLVRLPAGPIRRPLPLRDDVAFRPTTPRLTPRESEVVRLVSRGLTASQIATELRISAKTVENHKQRVFRKLDVQSQSHAVSVALRLGLLHAPRVPARASGS